MTYPPDPPKSAFACRFRDTCPSRPRRAPDSSPSTGPEKPALPHALRLSWSPPTTSRRVHEVTLRGQACAVGFGRATAPQYDICTPASAFVTKPNLAKLRRSARPFLTPKTTRLTASTGERSNRPPPRVVVVAPRPAQPLVGRVWTGGGLGWGRTVGSFPWGTLVSSETRSKPTGPFGRGTRTPVTPVSRISQFKQCAEIIGEYRSGA